MSMKEDKRIRLQLDFTEDGLNRIDQLRTALNAKSNAEVVRTAVRLLEWFVSHDKAGNKIFVVDPETNTQRQVELIIG